MVALGFSTLIKAFTDNVITPLVNVAGGGAGSSGLGTTVFGDPMPTKTCPECQSDGPLAASRCKYCTSELAAVS